MTMRYMRTITALIAMLFTVVFTFSSVQADSNPALWRIDNGETQVYLFGTVHLLPPNTSWQSARLKTLVKQADSLTLEVEDDPGIAPEIQKFTLQKGLYPAGQTLSGAIGADDFEQVKLVSQKVGLPPQALQAMRPWLAALSLTLQYAQAQGFQVDAGAEAWLTNKFKSRDKSVLGLEDPLVALGSVANHGDDVQKAMLLDTVEQLKDGGSVLGDLHDIWLKGDVEALETSLLEPLMEQEALFQSVLIERNKNWTPKIVVLLETPGTHLIAVGAAHLVGEGSVIDLLEAEGFTIERVE